MGAGKGLVDSFDKGVAGGIGDVETTPVVEGALVEVPIIGGGLGERNGRGFHGGKGVNYELVGGGGFGDFRGQGGVEHVDVKVGEKDLFGIVK